MCYAIHNNDILTVFVVGCTGPTNKKSIYLMKKEYQFFITVFETVLSICIF
jgi:hypothetical protein